ncbi:M15 family metallopeptidase [Kineosporia sp. J2-2]|uniref:M15 family metallopeptidase n=1 Tax=Kineosporia corallincola TaxID=2835133 RepID=A0ABS5T932_9ACTN|nr:M15 family metallopeptidase [Kineosporia corallincola]MBT0767577.1 M15 family metallopeptidase [Kineosporia corallincola]
MAEHSQNGWPVLSSNRLTWFSAAGGRFAAASSDVAFLARYLIERFDAEVENIDGRVLDDWSWADRNVRGSTSVISNHASATAWDLNALKHPRGARGTFTSARIARVHKILAGITDGKGHKIFRWGNDYVNATVDAMHFEINATKAQVKRARTVLEQRLEEEEDMKWTDQVKLTATDAKIWGGDYKEGEKVTFGLMVRYPTLARKTDAELRAFIAASAKRDAAMKAQLDTLITAVTALASGSSAEVSQAFAAGAGALQAEVARIDAEADSAQAALVSDAEIEADVAAAVAESEAAQIQEPTDDETPTTDVTQAERAPSNA